MIPFEMKHIDMIEAREHEATGLLQMDGIRDKLASLSEHSVECGTFMAGDEIVCCAGFVRLWDGVAEIWIIPSVHVPKHVRAFARTFKDYVERIVGELGYHRVQTSCLNDKLHRRWMKWLGLVPEGVMVKFTDKKEDFCMFARVN